MSQRRFKNFLKQFKWYLWHWISVEKDIHDVASGDTIIARLYYLAHAIISTHSANIAWFLPVCVNQRILEARSKFADDGTCFVLRDFIDVKIARVDR